MAFESWSSKMSWCERDDDSEAYAKVDVGNTQSALIENGRYAASFKGQKCLCRCCSLTVVSLVVSVVCVTVLLGGSLLFFHFVYSSDGFLTRSSDQETVCIPCAQIVPNPFSDTVQPYPRDLDVLLDKDGETEMCCASTPAQYAKFFKLVLQRQEEVKKLADILGSEDYKDDKSDGGEHDIIRKTTVSAHLLAKPQIPHDGKWATMQRWKSPRESPVSHVRGGLKFHNNSLIVHSEGMFFVYCQILFNRAPREAEDPEAVDSSSSFSRPTRLASHYMLRHSLLHPVSSGFLLKARHTRVSGLDDRHSSYVGGLFFLHTGDQVYVQVSVPELVSHDDQASFFGLFRVGN